MDKDKNQMEEKKEARKGWRKEKSRTCTMASHSRMVARNLFFSSSPCDAPLTLPERREGGREGGKGVKKETYLHNGIALSNVGQELVAQPFALRRAFDQARDVHKL